MWDRTSSPPPGPLEGASIEEKMARWDELSPGELGQIAMDPDLGPRLELLQRGEEWRLAGGSPLSICPSPEALYEYAQAPGDQGLAPSAHDQVHRHLPGCPDCTELVAQLGDGPPVYLLEGRPQAQRLRLLRGGALAAAASAAVLVVVPRAIQSDRPALAAWPTVDALRGPQGGALFSPGGSLLAPSTGAPWSSSLRFELEAVERADQYRVRVLSHSGGAFDLGEAVFEFYGDGPDLDSGRSLDPGHYTWEAWASVDGRETLLGSRDFELRADEEANAIAAQALEAQGVERVRLLHAARLFHDARRAAEALPDSPERDAYLQGVR